MIYRWWIKFLDRIGLIRINIVHVPNEHMESLEKAMRIVRVIGRPSWRNRFVLQMSTDNHYEDSLYVPSYVCLKGDSDV